MASFQGKQEWERPRKSENKKNGFDEFLHDPEQRIPKKKQKKFKKLKNTIMPTVQAKISRGRPRKSENKKNRSDEFLPDPGQRITKKQQKVKQHCYRFFSSQNWLGMAKKERK